MNVCNYRPVSILPIVSKIYEKEMVRQLENYFEDTYYTQTIHFGI